MKERLRVLLLAHVCAVATKEQHCSKANCGNWRKPPGLGVTPEHGSNPSALLDNCFRKVDNVSKKYIYTRTNTTNILSIPTGKYVSRLFNQSCHVATHRRTQTRTTSRGRYEHPRLHTLVKCIQWDSGNKYILTGMYICTVVGSYAYVQSTHTHTRALIYPFPW